MNAIVTRAELYKLVWSEPRTTLAKQFKMSDVAIGKHCRRANIPMPPPGYWARKLDSVFGVAEVEATARAYNTKAEIFQGMGHDMMLEPGWQSVAERIVSWLKEQRLGGM